MRKDHLRVQIRSMFLLLCILLTGPVSLLGNWGMEVGRANEGDQARLLQDWIVMKMARSRIERAVSAPLAKERQIQLLGLAADSGISPADLVEGVYAWFMQEVMAPAQRIGMNPAASCEEATLAMSSLLGMMRQRALLGMEDDEARAEELSRIFDANKEIASLRCRDEALDECVATGRFMQIPTLKLSMDRQAELLGISPDFDTWVDDALKQCAIYELHFVSTTKVAMPTVETVRDGKVPIKFEAAGGSIMDAAMSGKKLGELLKGETKGGNNPFFVSIKCALPGLDLTCSPGANSDPIRVGINEMEMQHREFYIGPDGISKVRIVGEDKFSMEFAGGIFALDAVIKAPNFSHNVPMPAHGYSFFIAHKKDVLGTGAGQGTGVKIEQNKRGAHPVIFQFTYADQSNLSGTLISDSTEFQLIHKPEPKPFPKRDPEPIRKPLIPRPGE